MAATEPSVRVGIFGTGGWARRTHIPHLIDLGAQIVCLCDAQAEAVDVAGDEFGIATRYTDGHQMLAEENLDVLYSCVPAYARTDVEATAARRGIHLFSEKPQSTSMRVARQIADAVKEGGVLSTVCFRERYRPLFQQARRLLQNETIVHARFQSPGGLPPSVRDRSRNQGWGHWMAKAGSRSFDWGVHAVDYLRFMTGLDVAKAQSFYHDPERYTKPLSSVFQFAFSTGATAQLSFVSATGSPPDEPWFTIFYEGGYLSVFRYDRIEQNGEIVYEAEEFDPWHEQDRVFIDAVRREDGSAILSDYADGLKSLAPVLACWESASRGGRVIDVPAFTKR